MANVKFTASRIDGFACKCGSNATFFWDASTPGLGVKVLESGRKSYIFRAKFKGENMKITIGSTAVWSLSAAQTEARRLQILVDGGQDPRQVKANAMAEAEQRRLDKEAEEAALAAKELSEAVTLGSVWPIYIADRSPHWGERHIKAHFDAMHAGGEKRKRSKELTKPGALASLAEMRLIDLTTDCINQWAKVEAQTRAASARLCLRLLKAFLTWCSEHATYRAIIQANAAKSKKVQESVGKAKVQHGVLQREQLAAWFSAVRQLENPVISAYLQCLLLTGARREEMMPLKWVDVDFRWASIKMRDKIEGERIVPLTPYVNQLLSGLPRRNEWVFSSATSEDGRLVEPTKAHQKVISEADLPHLTLHDLRRSFATLSEWVEVPAGVSAQIQGHAPQGVREQNYIRRPLDLLRMWHIKIEAWILDQTHVIEDEILQREQLAAWFMAVRQMKNPVTSAYLQCLLLTGAKNEELLTLAWKDVDVNAGTISLRSHNGNVRTIGLTPGVWKLLVSLPRRNGWVFSSTTTDHGCLAEPTTAHNLALTAVGLPQLTLHGLWRSFAIFSEWVETPAGIAAQIQGRQLHMGSELNFVRRPMDLLRMWHIKIEAWILAQAETDAAFDLKKAA